MEKTVAVPRLGSSDESDEVRILRWIKSKGDEVKKGGLWLEVEPDKDSVEVEAPDYGAVVAVIGK